MMKFGCANNRRRYRRLVKQPGERDLRARDPSRLGNFSEAVYYWLVRFFRPEISFFAVFIGLTARSAQRRLPAAARPTRAF